MKLEAAKSARVKIIPVQESTSRTDPLVFEAAVKRAIDLAVASAALFFLLPLLLLVILAIKLDTPGPILFRQSRGGKDGRPFKILKFRTMVVLEDGGTVVQDGPENPSLHRSPGAHTAKRLLAALRHPESQPSR
jgi:lipopolysaccharide/colanic/teichoic acid biosynthesis glycosyltransferase